MTRSDNRRVADLFRQKLSRYGDSAQAVDWGSTLSQRRRFEVLSGIGNLEGSSILDFGCGLGHFFDWLVEQAVRFRYLGIDVTPEMLTHSRRRQPGASFELGSYDDIDAILAKQGYTPDYVVASGVFYLDVAGGHDGLIENVAKLFAVAARGVAFNCLSSLRQAKHPNEFYAEPDLVLKRCLALTPWVALRHDYHPGDFTCFLWKEKQ